ncbi:MAG: hypothetical protein OXL96_20390 [Candidatus Poribacteria bacterium]|nr:hypothetical protein [Candidatus Poribacteria bacterium]
MKNEFDQKNALLLKISDPEIAAFYTDWQYIRNSSEFETAAHLLAHLAREILRGLEDRYPKDMDKKIYSDLIHRFDRYSHRRKGGQAPREKEQFEIVWPDFENLLVHLVESSTSFCNTADPCPFNTLCNSLVKLESELSEPEETERTIHLDIELSDQQSAIHQNLKTLAPLLAAFYRDWLRIRSSTDFKCRSYLLGHLAREIAGGFRDILAMEQDEVEIKTSLKNENLGNLKGHKGHIASIISALGHPGFDSRVEQWIETAKDLATLAHRNRDDKAKVLRKGAEALWPRFEKLLAYLVGGYLNLLNRVDKIVDTKEPSEDMIRTLPDLLKPEVLYRHFFLNLKSPGWLKPLKKEGWFDLQSRPPFYEVPDQPGVYASSLWSPLVYVEKVANHTREHPCGETIVTLVEVINDTITYIADNQERGVHQSTVWSLIKILDALPTEHIERQHIVFMSWALRWGPPLLVENEIEQTLFPKFLNTEAKELTFVFLEVMIKDSKMLSMMEKQAPAIVKLCGIEAVNIALKQIHNIIAERVGRFMMLQGIAVSPAEEPLGYDERLVHFICTLLRLAEFDSIAGTVEDLLQKSHDIFKRIALHAITHHYEDLKHLFWQWQGNPLEDTLLKPELYRLLQTNCRAFDESEIEQILQWIESEQDIVSSEDDEPRCKQEAYRRREWLSALMETGNKKVVAAYHKYEQINPAKLERPGLLVWTTSWEGVTSPTTVEELSNMSNAQIAALLNGFKDKGASGPSVPTEKGLAEMVEEYVALNPQRFANDLQPFQGVRNFYQYWILRGFLKAWHDKREFDWAKLLDFIHQLVSSEGFWAEQHKARYDGHSEWIFAVAELIEAGTRDSTHAFDVKLLPLAEKILLVLVEKVELRPSTDFESVPTAVVNSDRGRVFSAIVNYALQFARAHNEDQANRWPQVIKADFTRRLDRNVEPSFEFSFTLGMYLTYLLYLDETWLIDNIDRIFPQQDEYHWHMVFSGYLLYSRPLSESIYAVLKKHGHYQKALNSDFCNRQIDARVLPEPDVVYLDNQQIDLTVDRVVREKLVSDICLGWMEGFETLEDESSLIYQLVNSDNPPLLSTLIHYFWKKRDNLPEQLRTKVIPTWRALYESLSQKDDVEKYGEVLSRLSGWVALVDKIDGEMLKWLKISTQHIRGLTDSAFFVEELLPHATKTPAEVGDIYLGMLTHNVYPYHDQEHIQEIIRALYRTGHTEVADRICNLYGATGFNFLRALYDEYQN